MMKLNSYSHAILFFQISVLVCTSKSQARIELNAVILQGTRGGCDFDTITARADLETSIEYLVSEYAESLNKVCGCGYIYKTSLVVFTAHKPVASLDSLENAIFMN